MTGITISTTVTTMQTLSGATNFITVTNTGKVAVSGNDAVYVSEIIATVVNSGVLDGYGVGNGVEFGTPPATATTGGTVVNNSGAAIIGGGNGVYFAGHKGAGTVTNAGTIKGSASFGSGIWLSLGGLASNASTGSIVGAGYGIYGGSALTTIVNSGKIAGYNWEGVWIYSGGAVTNNAGGVITGGSLTGTGGFGGTQEGILIQGGVGTVVNAGTISDAHGPSVSLASGGIITNTGTGDIVGSTFGIVLGGAATITNAATIVGSGGTAVSMATGVTNRLIVDPGAVFTGKANGGTAADATLELASGASQGTLSGGLGSNYINFQTVQVDSTANWLIDLTSAATPSYTFSSIGIHGTIDVTGFTAASHGTLSGGTGLILNNASAAHVTLHFAASIGTHYTVTTGAFGTDVTNICFRRGTQILTPAGEVPVETLAVGDMVRTLNSPTPRKIAWVGKGKVLATRGRRGPATPVIIRKGALAENVPNRDLHVTKAHSFYLDDVLIPAEFLVNHKTIIWDDRAQEVEIFHIELESHDILIANGAPAESYRNDGNRWLFQNSNDGWHQPPQEPCAPVLTGGAVVDAVWARLLDRAGPRRLPPMTDDAELHLIADGEWIDVSRRVGQDAIFYIPWKPRSVRIVSRDVVPSEYGIGRDPRSLGVALRKIALQYGTKRIAIAMGDPRLIEGFNAYEPAEDMRWTKGDALLPPELFAPLRGGPVKLVLTLGQAIQYRDLGKPVVLAA